MSDERAYHARLRANAIENEIAILEEMIAAAPPPERRQFAESLALASMKLRREELYRELAQAQHTEAP